jgi:hypothetical protein
MQRFLFGLTAFIALGLLSSQSASGQSASPPKSDAIIPYYATLDRGLAEARRTGKPILFVSAAPHCAGVSGMW